MPSTAWKVATGTVITLVLAYAVVVAGQILLGVVAATLVFLVSWLVAYARESDAIPPLGNRRLALTSGLSVVVLAYSFLVAGQILLGLLAVVAIFAVAYGHSILTRYGYPASLGRTRTIVVVVLSVLILVYALVVAGQILLGFIAVFLLYVTAWLTSPTGPLLNE
ncbi:hypothetical protein SAMN04487948_105282 [Halogranum amylolyticum]|uniref:Uncharacterized protein n=1 Tax=Halogranum amylolyticum TaxID=660520 RepID=A0A1H8SRM6_9EURY|nr:hypothetical protein [Halogranum amylolyticum]SEO81237.1 hypothetical protein SAMN04487948_105282 [Halogranum amylolyticum]